jgi:hypothetical protein
VICLSGRNSQRGDVFTRLIEICTPRRDADYERQFVREVKIKRPSVNRVKSLTLVMGAWILIGLKCWAVIWAIGYYQIPVNPLWVTLPTLFFASLCTVLYFLGE